MTTPGPNDPNNPTGQSPQDPSVGQPGQGWGQQPPPPGPAQPGQPPQQFGQQGQPGQFGQQGPQQGQPGQFGQQGPQQGQPGQFGQQGPQPGQFGQAGPQGGFDQQGQPWAGQQVAGQGSAPEKPSWKKRLPFIIGAVVVALGLALFRNGVFGAGGPDVGDCVQQTGVDSVDTVDCDDSAAQFRVTGIDEERDNLDYAEFLADDSTCSQFDGITSQLWYGSDEDDAGTVYCLGDI